MIENKIPSVQSLKGNENMSKFGKGLALYFGLNRTENLNQALNQQVFPSAIVGSVFVLGSVLLFQVIGYTVGGKDDKS